MKFHKTFIIVIVSSQKKEDEYCIGDLRIDIVDFWR
jgi:hypothetical protein